MDSLQEQLRHLAAQPDFVAQFMQEGAYVFADRLPEHEAASLPPKGNASAETAENVHPAVRDEMPKTPSAAEIPATKAEEPKPVIEPQTIAPAAKASTNSDWRNKVVILLPPEPSIKEVQLLHKILAASGITEEEFFLQEKYYEAKSLGRFEGSRIVLSFGAVTDFKADYQLRSKAITVILADKLSHIESEVEAKKKLWAAMKSFFS